MPGDQIKTFLHSVRCDRLPVEFYGLNSKAPFVPSSNPPRDIDFEINAGWYWPSRLTNNAWSDQARKALAKALVAIPPLSQDNIRPDYCIVYSEPEGLCKVLWIDTVAMQMQLCVAGGPCPSDFAKIAQPSIGTVRGALIAFLKVAERAYNGIEEMQRAVEDQELPFDLMSIDPKPVDDVFNQKHWNVVGKTSMKGGDANWADVDDALNLAFYKDRAPAFTAQDFRPRLALSAKIGSREYLLLMSYESRLAELHIDGQSQGYYALSIGWNQRDNGGLPLSLSSDQLLNNILVANHVPLKPKSASTGN